MPFAIRRYGPQDSAETLTVFTSAIRITAAADYASEQLAAWAPDDIDRERWGIRRAASNTAVAVLDGAVVGFTDVDRSGYIDMLFVDPLHGRSGVATALLDWVVDEARRGGATTLTARVSITARPFFASHGFVVTGTDHPVVRGVALQNFLMSRDVA